jgi:hypothetical protein
MRGFVIVVDVGAMRQGPEESVHKLIGRFHPEVLFAFDPHPDFAEGVECVDGTVVLSRRAAAWKHTGTINVRVDGDCTGVDQQGDARVECFNFPSWLRTLPAVEIVAKFDAEGAEHVLLSALADDGLDERLALALVEWHSPEMSHGYFAERPTLHCPVEEWV